MVRKVLTLLLVFSWFAFSDVDMLENLPFESHSTASIVNSVAVAPANVNNNVESAHRILQIYSYVDLQSSPGTKLVTTSLDSGVSRSHKDNCVFRI